MFTNNCVILDSIQSQFTIESGSFEGCLSNLYIQSNQDERLALIFSQALEQENVEFDICSLN